MAIEYDYYAIAQKLKDAGADDTIKNNDGIEARTGIEGNKCIEFARFLQAEDGEEILAALEGLKNRRHENAFESLVFPNKGPGARAGHFPSFFSLFYNAKNPFFRKIHSFSKPVPLPPVRKS